MDPQLDVTGTSNRSGVGKILVRKDPKTRHGKSRLKMLMQQKKELRMKVRTSQPSKKFRLSLWFHGPAIQVKNFIVRLMTHMKP